MVLESANSKENEGPERVETVSVGSRYPADRKKLLEALQIRRRDRFLSDTINAALDDFLADHGLIDRAA